MTTGAEVDHPGPLTLDLASGRIYWGNYGSETIDYAKLSGGGGGELDTSPVSLENDATGLAIDPSAGRIYWSENESARISYANLGGGGGGELNTEGATFERPYGIAIDPLDGRVYWGNYGNGEVREGAIAYASLGGGGGGDLTISAPATVSGPQDPVVLASPSALAPPTIAGGWVNGSVLTCSRGVWAADYAGSYTYRAPHAYAYRWTLNGVPIAGATAPTLAATQGGGYACTVTAANAAGSATQASTRYAVAGAVRVKKVRRNKRKGIATIVARVSAPGLVTLTWQEGGQAAAQRQSGGYREADRQGQGQGEEDAPQEGQGEAGDDHPLHRPGRRVGGHRQEDQAEEEEAPALSATGLSARSN